LSLLPGYDVHPVPRDLRSKLEFRYGFGGGRIPAFNSEFERWSRERGLLATRTLLGRALKEYTRPGESLINSAMGAVAYHCDLFFYDPVGLVSAEVAHRKVPRQRQSAGHDKSVEAAYFLKYRPTYYQAFIADVRKDKSLDVEPGRWFRFRGSVFSDRDPDEVRLLYEPLGRLLAPADKAEPPKVLVLFVRREIAEDRLRQTGPRRIGAP
jgi:hypothetical protein